MELKDIAKVLGQLGGKKTSEKYGRDHYKRMSELGVKARREKKKQLDMV